ncbi:MAG: glycosyltransferase family 2 protein, partial [Brevibacterium sp.]|nr:glycosyltransferase family 2 protein [Brevibacterium sp.]
MNYEPPSEEAITERTRNAAVTVVVPAYNSADTIVRTLDSLTAQTSTDFCVLVIDDGSDEEILGLMPDDPRFLGHRLQTNRGYAGVTNCALGLISSRWVIFLDSDDTFDPECLEVLVARGEMEDSDVVVLPLKTITASGAVSIAGVVDTPYSDLGFVFNLLSTVSTVSFETRPMYNYFLNAESVTGQLRPSIWDLATVLDDVEDALYAVYSGREAVEAIHRMRWMQLNFMVSKAAGDTQSPRLQAEVYSWCRNEIRFSHVVDAMRSRHVARGLSLALARMSRGVHSRAYRLRGR